MQIKYRYIQSLSVGYLYFVCTLPNPQFIHPSSSARLYYICSGSSHFSLSTVYPQIDESFAWIKWRYPHIIHALPTDKFTHNFGMDKVKTNPGYPWFICASLTCQNRVLMSLDKVEIKWRYPHFIRPLSKPRLWVLTSLDKAEIKCRYPHFIRPSSKARFWELMRLDKVEIKRRSTLYPS